MQHMYKYILAVLFFEYCNGSLKKIHSNQNDGNHIIKNRFREAIWSSEISLEVLIFLILHLKI